MAERPGATQRRGAAGIDGGALAGRNHPRVDHRRPARAASLGCRAIDRERPLPEQPAQLARVQWTGARAGGGCDSPPAGTGPVPLDLPHQSRRVLHGPGRRPQPRAAGRLPEGLPRLVSLPDGRGLVPLEDVVRANLDLVYRGREVEAAYTFRVTRSGDLELDERRAENLLHVVEEEAQRRPYGDVVRLEVERGMRGDVRRLLLRELQFEDVARVSTIGPGDLFDVDGLLDPLALLEIADLARPELQYPPFQGRRVLDSARSVFDLVGESDVLFHHPYDSFTDTVERFFVEAADDPEVVAIKLTLYRAGGRYRIVDALVRAAAAR